MKIFKHIDHGGIPQLITKSNWVGQAVYGHAKSMMAFPTHLLVLHLLGNCFQEELPHNFSQELKLGCMILFISCPWGATPLRRTFQKGVTLVSSCKSWMPILPCLYVHFVPDLSDSRQCFLPQSVASGVWETREEILPEKTEAKKSISTWHFSVHFISSSSPSPSPAMSSPCLWSPFCCCCTCGAFAAFHIPQVQWKFQFQLHLGVDLPDSIPACLSSGSTCFLDGLSLFPPACFVFAAEFKTVL